VNRARAACELVINLKTAKATLLGRRSANWESLRHPSRRSGNRAAINSVLNCAHCGFRGYQFMLRSRSLVRALLTSTVVAAAMALAACTSDGTPASTESSGGIDSFVRNLFGSKNQDQAPVTHNEPPVGPSAPKSKAVAEATGKR
jgi:hypothetical protein